MTVVHLEGVHGPRVRPVASWLRRRNDVWLALIAGLVVAMLVLGLPMEAALASSVVGAFVIIALIDTRVALLALLFVRSIIDVGANVSVLATSPDTGFNAAALMGVLIIGIGVLHIGMSRLDVWSVPLTKPFAAYLAIAGLGLAIAPDFALGLEDWLRAASTFMVYVLVVDLMGDERDTDWVIRILIAAAVIPVVVGLYQLATGTGYLTDDLHRLSATFTHPAPYAFFLVGLLPLAAARFAHTTSKFERVALGLMVPAMALCIYASQTRGAWVGLTLIITVFLWTRARWAVVLVPLAAAAAFFALPSVQDRVSESTSETGSVAWRQRQWERSLELPSAGQLLTIGAGLRAVDVELGELTHNEYVRLLAETGILGLGAVLILYAGLLRIAIRGYRDAPTPYQRDVMLAFLMVFAARAVSSFADNLLIFPALEWYFWAYAGVVVCMSGVYKRRRVDDRRAPRTAAPEPAA